MISSSRPLDHCLDTMVVVYCVLDGHPGGQVCEQFLTSHEGWFTSPLVLFEAHATLTKVYSVAPAAATRKLAQFSTVPVALPELDGAQALAAFQLAATYDLDLTDAVLLELARNNGARYMATDDAQLAHACARFGIAPLSPIDPALRQTIAAWETLHLAPKGLPRVLRRVHDWLGRSYAEAAREFWSKTGAGSHLP